MHGIVCCAYTCTLGPIICCGSIVLHGITCTIMYRKKPLKIGILATDVPCTPALWVTCTQTHPYSLCVYVNVDWCVCVCETHSTCEPSTTHKCCWAHSPKAVGVVTRSVPLLTKDDMSQQCKGWNIANDVTLQCRDYVNDDTESKKVAYWTKQCSALCHL